MRKIIQIQHRTCCSVDDLAARRHDLIGCSGQSCPCSCSVVSLFPTSYPAVACRANESGLLQIALKIRDQTIIMDSWVRLDLLCLLTFLSDQKALQSAKANAQLFKPQPGLGFPESTSIARDWGISNVQQDFSFAFPSTGKVPRS